MKHVKSLLLALGLILLISCAPKTPTPKQSPIALETATAKVVTSPEYLDSQFGTMQSVEDTGHSVKFSIDGETLINGKTYRALQMHFHNSSEHTLDGVSYPLEGHIVHENIDDPEDLLVMGIFYEVGAANPDFQPVLDYFVPGDDINVSDNFFTIDSLIPADKAFFHYKGSLTTYPYSENVSWYVMETPISISQEQLDKHNDLHSHNNREIQDLNKRVVTLTR
ncbi:MAG: carbonic anhydrase family protein [Treponemataceae bacterium]